MFSRQFQKNVPPRFQKQAAEYMRQQTQQPPAPSFMRSQSVGQTSPGTAPLSASVGNPPHGEMPIPPLPGNFPGGWTHPPYVNQMSGKWLFKNASKLSFFFFKFASAMLECIS